MKNSIPKILSIVSFTLWSSLSVFANPYEKAMKEVASYRSPVFMDLNPAYGFLKKNKMLPVGTALITSSGKLNPGMNQPGIEAIIHAAPAAMTRSGKGFDPSKWSIEKSVMSSLMLAHKRKFNRIALPLIGGGIFLSRLEMTKEELSKLLVRSVLKTEKRPKEVVFVIYGNEQFQLFENVLKNLNVGASTGISVLEGSITNYDLHCAPVIVNAANQEVEFGGGVSGVIGAATENEAAINLEAKRAIQKIADLIPNPVPKKPASHFKK